MNILNINKKTETFWILGYVEPNMIKSNKVIAIAIRITYFPPFDFAGLNIR